MQQKRHHDDASHVPWSYRLNAFRWAGGEIKGVNFVPFATAIHDWLQQRGDGLPIASAQDREESDKYTNPHTYGASTLTLSFARTVNELLDFVDAKDEVDPVDAEVIRIRMHGELILQQARISEALIKQLLFCTALDERKYQNATLGDLIAIPCRSCKEQSVRRHKVSYIGSLAHAYHRCLEFDECVIPQMLKINSARKSVAAHAQAETLNLRTAAQSRNALGKESKVWLDSFTHMLSHMADLEELMLDDIARKAEKFIVSGYKNTPDLIPGSH